MRYQSASLRRWNPAFAYTLTLCVVAVETARNKPMVYRKRQRTQPLSTHITVGKKAVPVPMTRPEYNKSVKRHVDFAEQHRQNEVAYFGFSSFSRLDALDILAETIWRKIAKRAGSPFTTALSRSRAFPTYWPDRTDSANSYVQSHVRAVRFIWRSETAQQMNNPVDGQDAMMGDTYYTWTLADESGDTIKTNYDKTGFLIPAQENAFHNWASTTAGNQSANTLTELTALLRSKLDVWGTKGRYLTQVQVFTCDKQQELRSSSQPSIYRMLFEMNGLADAKMKFRVRGENKLQNITPATIATGADAGGTAQAPDSYLSQNIASNSLVGKVFKFAHPTPRFRDQYLQQLRQEQRQDVANVMVPSQDGRLSTKWLRIDGTYTGNLYHDYVQPCGTTPFRNCQGTTSIKMKAGGILVLHTDFVFTGTMRRFLVGLSQGSINPFTNSYTLPVVGDCYMFALENYVRCEDGTQVVIACNREQHYTCDYSVKQSDYIIPSRLVESVIGQGE